MTSTLFYFLQVIVCSAVLFAYYVLVLRDKKFHQYNRFYLLSVLLMSWLIPMLRFSLPFNSAVDQHTAAPFRMFEVVADNNTHLESYVAETASAAVNWSGIVLSVYVAVCALLLIRLIAGVARLLLIAKRSLSHRIDGAQVIFTSVKGAPFSFFNLIFWNREIDMNTSVGQQILQHEISHVKEKHSIDKVFSALVLATGWFNPIFWMARKELHMVHEFIADKKAVNDDPAELAQMLLTASLPSKQISLANSFFHSPIKRRIFMMCKFDGTKYSYLRRVLILPLLCLTIMLFAFRKQVTVFINPDPVKAVVETPAAEAGRINSNSAAVKITPFDVKDIGMPKNHLSREFVVMLDAGHGGHDGGAMAADGTKESDVTLELVKAIIEENSNNKIKLVLTRETDVYQHPKTKVELTQQSNADVLVSVHVAASNNKSDKGVELYIPTRDTFSHYKVSYNFANVLANTLSGIEKNVQIKKREMGIWILNAAERPAVLIEAGFLSNADDLKKLKDKEYQRQLARAILNGIERYLGELEKNC